MKALLIFILFASIIAAAHGQTFSAPGSSLSTWTEKGLWLIEYHLVGNKVSYAVISGPSTTKRIDGSVTTSSSSNGAVSARLKQPDNTLMEILDTGRVFQIIDGKLAEFEGTVTAKEFTAFLDSGDRDFSLIALRAFLKRSRNSK